MQDFQKATFKYVGICLGQSDGEIGEEEVMALCLFALHLGQSSSLPVI